MTNIAAFFDIDGTLYREGLITEIFKKMIKSDIIDIERWYNEVREKYLSWDRRTGNYDDYLLKIAEIYTDAIAGLHKTQIKFIAKKVVEQKGDRVYTYTRDRIKFHLNEGHRVIVISGSPAELVEEMAQKHHVHDFIGTEYLVDKNDIYTGKVKPMWDSVHKRVSIDFFVNKYNLNLAQSYAYGDTAGDFSMFSAVAYPTAINPTRELMIKIKNNKNVLNKTKIVVERKDMIYKLTPNDIEIEY
ncbi:HAD-IB family hydrolase [Clostridium sp. 'deep sea']|uniref:HAD-IB family hydrolase n=1 Tax=Clostridium sp. 'deep sea' TaxID=2779445 RepID=UPI0018965E38|nr:HAD-IB family hydrolase [Clostridium sp. 'deep sea']QOR35285.1 HAD-IB family hydrolase [Clostridium sp. 'deep sea']